MHIANANIDPVNSQLGLQRVDKSQPQCHNHILDYLECFGLLICFYYP